MIEKMTAGRKKPSLDRLFQLMDIVDNGNVTNEILDEIRKIRKEQSLSVNQSKVLRELSRKA